MADVETTQETDGFQSQALNQDLITAASLCVQCKGAATTKETQSDAHLVTTTSCCGQHVCQECVSSMEGPKRQCPSCGEVEVSVITHKETLEAGDLCAVFRENGYTARGGDTLDPSHTTEVAHRGDSERGLVQCTNSCGQQVEEQTMSTHLESECPKREITCAHCNLKALYEFVIGEHCLQCPHYPVPCPNECGITAKRSDIDEHLNVCLSQETQCEFSVIGCKETFPRKEQEKHMQISTQTHLILMSSTLTNLQDFQHKQQSIFDVKLKQTHIETEHMLKEQQNDFETRFLQQQDKFKRMLKRQQTDFEQKLKEETEKHLQLELTLQAKDQLIQENMVQLNQLQEELNMVVLQSPPYQFTMTNFKQLKTDNKAWNSLPMYTNPGGYKVCVRVRPNGLPWSRGFRTHMSVWFFAMKGDYDESLVWPAEATITLQLLNQHHDKRHLTVTRRYHWRKDIVDTTNHTAIGVILDKLISHEDLELNSQEETHYLKDNCLRFRITDIVVHT